MLNIELIEYQDITCYSNSIKFSISGSYVNNTIINTIRRELLLSIPMYTFDTVIIDVNTSIFNSDMMRHRLKQIPIFNITNDINEINPRSNIYSYTPDKKNNDGILNIPILQMNVDVTNKTNDIVNVTTDDAKFIFYGRNIDNKKVYEVPMLLCKLKPLEKFKATSQCTRLGTCNHDNASFTQVYKVGFNCKDNQNYIFRYEAEKQLNIKEYFIRACLIIIQKSEILINNIIKMIQDKNDDLLYNGTIVIDKENHTYSGLITRFLQDNENVNYAGFKIDNLLEEIVVLKYELKQNSKSTIVDILKKTNINIAEVFNTYINVFDKLNILKIK